MQLPDKPTDDQLVEQQFIAATFYQGLKNDRARLIYANEVDSYRRNKPLNDAINIPTLKPTPPSIVVIDHDRFVAAAKGNPDVDLATVSTTTIAPDLLTATDNNAPIPQPAIPIGKSMLGGYYAEAPGDTTPDGGEYTNPFGVKFHKYVHLTSFGRSAWWQAA